MFWYPVIRYDRPPLRFADDPVRRPAPDDASGLVEPDDGAGRATLDGLAHIVVSFVIDDRQVVDHRHDARGVGSTAPAGIASDLAVFEDGVAFLQVSARDPQAMADRM